MTTPTISTNGVHHATDEAIDHLYAWMPPQAAPQSCPEALFSLTLKGKLDGVETLLTVRGMTAAEFQANLASVRGVLDPVPAKTASPPAPIPAPGEDYCRLHQLPMRWNEGKPGRTGWYSHRTAEGQWCKGK